MPRTTEPQFFEYLKNLTAAGVSVHAMDRGIGRLSRRPSAPSGRTAGRLSTAGDDLPDPHQLCQVSRLIVPALPVRLTLIGSLITTNAARYRMAAGKTEMLEFGLRRAQGPDGGLSASKYSYVGGCDATSNVLAGKLFHIPVKGTHAHAFVMSFMPKEVANQEEGQEKRKATDDFPTRNLRHKDTDHEEDFVHLCESYRREIAAAIPHVIESQVNDGELAAFIAYALSFPDGFLALIDTYDVSK